MRTGKPGGRLLPTLLLQAALAHEPYGATTQLPDAPGLLDRWDAQRAWGSPLAVDALLQALHRLAWERPGLAPVTVGDLSVRGGGPMPGHRTHDLGVDADLGLYVRGGRQPDGFLDVPPEQLDVDATWALIAALLDTGNVQFILLDQAHIERLRGHLLAAGTPPEAVDRVFVPRNTRLQAGTRGVIRHAPNHRSHLHVRFGPAPQDPPVN